MSHVFNRKVLAYESHLLNPRYLAIYLTKNQFDYVIYCAHNKLINSLNVCVCFSYNNIKQQQTVRINKQTQNKRQFLVTRTEYFCLAAKVLISFHAAQNARIT